MKDYLGDSVYAEFDGHGLTLTTENGYGPSNTIYVEPEVWRAMTAFMKRMTETQTEKGEPCR
jgi:hypothetical protein